MLDKTDLVLVTRFINRKNATMVNYRYTLVRDATIILIFFLVLRGVARWLIRSTLDSENCIVIAKIGVDFAMYAGIFIFCKKRVRLELSDAPVRAKDVDFRFYLIGFGLGLTLFAFMIGETALEVRFAQIIKSSFRFSSNMIVANNLSPNLFEFLIFALVGGVVGPFVEEYFFRRIIFFEFAKSMNMHAAAILSSGAFAFSHLVHPYLIFTMIFSLTLTYLYVYTGSVGICAIAHGTFNVATFWVEQFGQERLTETVGTDANFVLHIHVALLVISTLILAICASLYRSDPTMRAVLHSARSRCT